MNYYFKLSEPSDDDVIESDDYLEHAQHEGYYSPNLGKVNSTTVPTSGSAMYRLGKCYVTTDSYRGQESHYMHVVLTNLNRKQGTNIPDFVIPLDKYDNASAAVNDFLNNMQNWYPSFWSPIRQDFKSTLIKEAHRLWYNNSNKPQHAGYYSPNLSHSVTIDSTMCAVVPAGEELAHFGILGMKWGVRRYQNPDGSLTAEGRKRYGVTKSNLKTFSSDEKIGRELIQEEVRKNIESGKDFKKISESLIEDYKTDYIKDISDQLPENLGKINREKLLESLAKQQVDSIIYDEADKQYVKIMENKLRNNPHADGDDYVDYLEENHDYDELDFERIMYDKEYGKEYEKEYRMKWEADYKKNNNMTSSERKIFDILEENLKKIDDEKEKDRILKSVSQAMDARGRDMPSVLVYDKDSGKILAYPSVNEFNNPNSKFYNQKFDDYLNDWDMNLAFYTWGEEYDEYD